MPEAAPLLLPMPHRLTVNPGFAQVPEGMAANIAAWSLRVDHPPEVDASRGWMAVDATDPRIRHPEGYRLTIRPWRAGASRWPIAA